LTESSSIEESNPHFLPDMHGLSSVRASLSYKEALLGGASFTNANQEDLITIDEDNYTHPHEWQYSWRSGLRLRDATPRLEEGLDQELISALVASGAGGHQAGDSCLVR
jgi:hypothetical protein